MTIIFTLIITFFILEIPYASGQVDGNYDILSSLEQKGKGEGELKISMNDLIIENLHRHIHYNANNPDIPGYRIRIFSDSGFDSYDRAISVRTRFISKHENIGAYLQYDVPDYKIYVGDCRTKSEALKIFEAIKSDFPYAFIVPQNINLDKE